MMEASSFEIFCNSIRAKTTLDIYKKRLEEFHKFTKIKSYDSYLSMQPREIENLIMQYVFYLKQKIDKKIIGPNAIQQRIAPIELFMSQNDVILNTKKIHRTYPRKVKTKGELPYTREDIQAMLDKTTKPRDKALITFFASNGVRPEAVLSLQYRHLKEMEGNCYSVIIYEDDIEEYPVFLTPEASGYLKKYLKGREFYGEEMTPSTPLFRSSYRKKNADDAVKPFSYNALKASMQDIVKRAKIREEITHSNQRHQKALFGGFRKWFETTLNNVDGINPSITEKLMGHRNDLRKTYYNPNTSKRFAEFCKAIPSLTISETARQKATIEKLKSKQDFYDLMVSKIPQLQQAMRELDEKCKTLEKKSH